MLLEGLPFAKQCVPSSFRDRTESELRESLAMEIRGDLRTAHKDLDRDKGATGKCENRDSFSLTCYVIARVM